MILKISIIYIFHLGLSQSTHLNLNESFCLTGYMTDLQSWVTKDGQLTVNDSYTVDLSEVQNVAAIMEEYMENSGRRKHVEKIKYLSIAKSRLQRVPQIFTFRGNLQNTISETLEYVTFYGNAFGIIRETGAYESSINATNAKELSPGLASNARKHAWSFGLRNVTFRRLRQLDLRACKIDTLDAFTFKGMPSLTHLYLGENKITFIDANAFVGLSSIIHIDLSRNTYTDKNDPVKALTFESMDTFAHLNLISLDLSFTPLSTRNIPLLSRLGNKLVSLSICYTEIFKLRPKPFGSSPLKYLDISGNSDVLSDNETLKGLEDTLRVLYAHSTLLRSLHVFKGFTKLEILKVSHNEITDFPIITMETLRNLQVLDLGHNRISSWFSPVISSIPRLKLLSLEKNNLNMISDLMLSDMSNVNYLSLSRNSMICNCLSREIYEIAYQNELKTTPIQLEQMPNESTIFHVGYLEYNNLITNRKNLTSPCLKMDNEDAMANCSKGLPINTNGSYLFLDYDKDAYSCLYFHTGNKTYLSQVPTCPEDMRDMPDDLTVATKSNSMLLLILLIILPILGFIYIFRRNFRYFLITIRNSAMLSLISDKDVNYDENKLFNYDVFVSYCNEDRAWVLDHLLPHVEIDCNISVCLHERDFQVGLSILENIVSCMDRSRSIMLIISRRFLLSQWCQFEMHLAQHRLLETRREDLILILIEDIPRRLRPNTLHFLMLTKTYIVWPKEESEKKEFWKRMKRSLVTQKLKNVENHSLA
ncbi:toll-like receptor 3 [Pieris brassicae]|uniref:toll-like receptor 3 n=1 Tax=Pieris brassicae TaxID=7116 RepID=UPI001E660EBE|nr:toll-like receptor 3 [Pieris brassicae]